MASTEKNTSRADNEQKAAPPSISLPKGGGAIRGMGEKFAANPVTGTGSMTVPIATSPGRSGFGPQLSLSYDSGSGNGPFGFGWSLSLPSITRKTDKGLPRYLDGQNQAPDSDVFILSGTEDLVPEFEKDAAGNWVLKDGTHVIHDTPRTIDGATYNVRHYRPRIEGLFARIERWTNQTDLADTFWRSISKDNITTWYGRTEESRIFDPADRTRIFSWLICQSYDDKGNTIIYEYQREDSERIFEDQHGQVVALAHERNRNEMSRTANRYLKRIKYGNRKPNRNAVTWEVTDLAQLPIDTWMFEVVFDYGEGHYTEDAPDTKGRIFAQSQIEPPAGSRWPARQDPFSTYRAGFEIRTYRLCQRVLMFHHFPAELGTADYLVRSTDFTYSYEDNPQDTRNPIYSFLKSVSQSGYVRQSAGSYFERSLPPLEFVYTNPEVQNTVQEVDAESLENLPVGLDGASYQWTDLHGEGIPGILTEQGGAWFYKRNLSPLPVRANGMEFVKARLAPVERVASKPNLALGGGAQFMDLAGDGQPDLVVLDGPTPGLYEHDEAEGWQPFRPFTSQLNRDTRDPNLKFVDLDGDGHADVLISEDNAFVWHPSLAEEGFGPARCVAQALDEENGPRLVFADGTQSIYLADMSGDGLTDLVRIRNGELCYWPNLGYGRFGSKVTMDHAPHFDHPDQFDHKRMRLADIDGSGTTDIIYLHRDGVRIYFNQSGNGWSNAVALAQFPPIDNISSVQTLDLLGNGTACLVWSSPLPAVARRPMRYLALMKEKPHLLVGVKNNLGAETKVHYAPSTKFYLDDKRAGKSWITRLPFPVHVVERVETHDHISRNRFVTRYAYHHGYFDGEEREFRGFGMVEQWDTEEFAALAGGNVPADNIAAESHVPPVRTKTWFHTGVYLGRDHVSDYFAGLLNAIDQGEYFREPGLTDGEARALLLPDTLLPAGLTLEEEREACRALKGSMLRQEVYADDAEHPGATPEQIQRARTPYTVTEQNLTIRALQKRGANHHAVFFTHANEALSYHYERNPTDPRIQQVLTLEVDGYGNVLKQAAIGYGRRVSPLSEQWDRDRQTTALLTYTENRVTNAIESPDTHRNPLPCEAMTFELTGYTPTGAAGGFQASDLVEPDPAAGRLRHKFTDQVPYEAAATGNPCRRPIEWLRTLYRRGDLSGLLPLGELHSLALPGESYKLAFTPGLLTQVFQRPRADQPAEPLLYDPVAVLGGQAGNQGGYLRSQTMKADRHFPATDADDHWWIPSGQSFFTINNLDAAATELAQARQHFFLPRRYRDPFGQDAFVDFDVNDMLMAETRDALGNRVTVEANDYRVLQPRLVSDPNRNRTEVAFDTLGMVVGTAVMGKPLPAPVEGDSLDGFIADVTQTQLDQFMNAPRALDPVTNECKATQIIHDLLNKATTRIVYDLDRFTRLSEPPFTATLARETHVSDLPAGQQTKIQVSLSYSDGFGREIQKKIQAEKGKVPLRDPNGRIIVGPNNQPVMSTDEVEPRWVGSGWTVFNNKGKPIRQFEPFFTDTHRFEFDVRIGVSPVLFYDPAERVVATLHPNHTYEKVVVDPWRQATYDMNDTAAANEMETGDPRTDKDIAGYAREYFKTQPNDWQTWYQERITGAKGAEEKSAAEKAAKHADTPTTAHFDSLGRTFLTLAHNRVVCANHPDNGKEESYATRVEMDIEGNQRAVRDAITKTKTRDAQGNEIEVVDPLGRVVMRYDCDMLGNRIHQASMEAGERWMLNDVIGKPIRAWDGRGHNFKTGYDALRRPVAQYVRGTAANSDPRTVTANPAEYKLVDKIEYGESQPSAETVNLCTRIYRHYDSAGVVTNAAWNPHGDKHESYDFKGNLLRSTRRLVSDYTAIPDWLQNPKLDDETFESSTRYDALNRPIQSIAPHSSLTHAKRNIIQPVFNEASLLERVDVWLKRATEPGALLHPNTEQASPVGVANIDYNAKGQRTRIDYKNGAATHYSYDPDTFRLVRLRTVRGNKSAADCSPVLEPRTCEDPPAVCHRLPTSACVVQDLSYTYDPAGNITHIRDDAQQIIYFMNRIVEPSNDYTYDALYRLIEATGREHLGLAGGVINPPTPHSYNDAPRVGLLHPGDGNAMGTYTEKYVYDAVGNFMEMKRIGSDPAHAWTRAYAYNEASLTEPAKQSNRLSSNQIGNGTTALPEQYTYDAHGNMRRMSQLQVMQWDFKDQLQMSQRQRVNDNDTEGVQRHGERTWYVYDSAGQRIRKVTESAAGQVKHERVYLGGFEIYREYNGGTSLKLERETLYIMDDKQRIALVETRTQGNEPGVPEQLIRYQFGNHLGSASLELDDQAQIISYEEYTPYGSTSYQASRSRAEVSLKRYRYTGKERDEESGLYYHGARYYALWLGRWIATDPLSLRDGLNLYRYCSSNPVKLRDAHGTNGRETTQDELEPPKPGERYSIAPHGKHPPKVRRRGGTNLQGHHPIQDEWAKQNVAGYESRAAPSQLLETGTGEEHTRISNEQRANRPEGGEWGKKPYSEARAEAVEQYRKAGLLVKEKQGAEAILKSDAHLFELSDEIKVDPTTGRKTVVKNARFGERLVQAEAKIAARESRLLRAATPALGFDNGGKALPVNGGAAIPARGSSAGSKTLGAIGVGLTLRAVTANLSEGDLGSAAWNAASLNPAVSTALTLKAAHDEFAKGNTAAGTLEVASLNPVVGAARSGWQIGRALDDEYQLGETAMTWWGDKLAGMVYGD